MHSSSPRRAPLPGRIDGLKVRIIDDSRAELASLLARGVRRFLEQSRPDAVSCAATTRIPLEVSGPESTHVVEHETP